MTAHLLQEDSHLATLTKGQSGQMMAACFVQAKYLVDTLNVIGLFVWERRKYVQQFDRSCGTFEPKLLEINAYLICKTFEWWYQNNNQCSIIPFGFLGTAWRLWATRPLAFPPPFAKCKFQSNPFRLAFFLGGWVEANLCPGQNLGLCEKFVGAKIWTCYVFAKVK